MVHETDTSREKAWLYEEQANIVVENLKKNKMNAWYFPIREKACAAILEMIPSGAVVARGDSISVDQVGIMQEMEKRNQNTIIDPMARTPGGYYSTGGRERFQLQREAFLSDIFITSANAVTLDGKIVSTDGIGNRVSAMIFGPEKVLLIAGMNKITRNVDDALERIHRVAAPLNAKRHLLKHHAEELTDLPCIRVGKCADCHNENRICNYTVIIQGAMKRQHGRINVILVGEELGL